MNVELLGQVREHIRSNPEDYDQGDQCRCIWGHALIFAGVVKRDDKPQDYPLDMVPAMLGITQEQADSLYWLKYWPGDLSAELIDGQVAGDKRQMAEAVEECALVGACAHSGDPAPNDR